MIVEYLRTLLRGTARYDETPEGDQQERLPDAEVREPAPMEIVMDGADVLNWRSSDPQIEALILRPSGSAGEAVTSQRSISEGPPHGSLRVDVLTHEAYEIAAIRAGVEEEPLLEREHSGAGTENIAWGPGGRVWTLEESSDRGIALVSRAEADARFGIRSLRAQHGMVTLVVAPMGEDGVVQLEDRASKTVVEAAEVRREGDAVQYRIGAAQWASMVEGRSPGSDSAAVWNLYAADGDAHSRRRRLGWAGSAVKEPREALRYRATTSLMVPGRQISIRPYWTRDQYLALELKITSSTEGELT